MMRSPWSNGSPFMSAPYMMLNIVVVRPMPKDRAVTATKVSPGLLRSERNP